MNCTLSADQSASFLAGKLRRQERFSYWRFGDGFLECVAGKSGATCDGEPYSPALAAQLMRCWRDICDGGEDVYLGDWQSASFSGPRDPARYADQHRALIGERRLNWLHFEALLLMRESAALADFYRAVREDPRKKLFMGPAGNRGACVLLNAEFLETPMRNLGYCVGNLTEQLLASDFEVLLFGAGMAGNIPAVSCWKRHPERTYISLGSAMDTLFRGRSRQQQLPSARARELMQQVSGQPGSVLSVR